tara:strand:- start:334 stop:1398 length:1065 start_codon:yes stop_codon:yes gene_type:complete
MATLSGTKVKDKFGNLLQVNGGVDGTLSTVEDGNGNTSALKLSSTEVQLPSTGTKFTGTPSGSASELTMLMVNSSNQVITRELDSTLSTAINFDSGWKDLQINASTSGTFYGLNYATAAGINNNLEYRVINRTVFLKGDLYIPLDKDGTTGTGALATTVAENKLYNRNTVNTESGWTATGGEIVSPHIFNKDTIDDSGVTLVEQDLRMWIPFQRTINEEVATTTTTTYCTFGCITIDSDFKIRFRSFHYYSSGDAHVINPVVETLPRFRTGAPFLNYDNYFTDASGGSDKRTVASADFSAGFDFDGRGKSTTTHSSSGDGVKGWGGLVVTLDGLFFNLESSNTIDAISSRLQSQ